MFLTGSVVAIAAVAVAVIVVVAVETIVNVVTVADGVYTVVVASTLAVDGVGAGFVVACCCVLLRPVVAIVAATIVAVRIVAVAIVVVAVVAAAVVAVAVADVVTTAPTWETLHMRKGLKNGLENCKTNACVNFMPISTEKALNNSIRKVL